MDAAEVLALKLRVRRLMEDLRSRLPVRWRGRRQAELVKLLRKDISLRCLRFRGNRLDGDLLTVHFGAAFLLRLGFGFVSHDLIAPSSGNLGHGVQDGSLIVVERLVLVVDGGGNGRVGRRDRGHIESHHRKHLDALVDWDGMINGFLLL